MAGLIYCSYFFITKKFFLILRLERKNLDFKIFLRIWLSIIYLTTELALAFSTRIASSIICYNFLIFTKAEANPEVKKSQLSGVGAFT